MRATTQAKGRMGAALLLALLICCTPDPAPAPDRPNLLFISIDATRADHLSSYGFEKNTTPHIDRLANTGVRFASVFSTAPTTVPAHASMMTGMIPPAHGVRDNTMVLSGRAITLAEVLSKHGFRTGAIIGAAVLRKTAGLAQGFKDYDDRVSHSLMEAQFMNQRRGSDVADRALAWLDRHGQQPFFLFVHFFDPHGDYVPPEPFATQFKGDPYAGEIAYADAQVGRLIDKLKSKGLYESTIIVVTSDHGEGLGEHKEGTHSYFVYQSTIAVPWVMHVPSLQKPTVFSEPTSLIDQMPTLLGLMKVPPPMGMQGRDLSPVLQGQSTSPPTLYSECMNPSRFGAAPLFSVVNNDWKYIHSSKPELYHLGKDPAEANNLFAKEPDRAKQLREELEQLVANTGAGASNEGAPRLSPEQVRMLESLGYIASVRSQTEYVRDETRESPVDFLPDFKEHAIIHGKTEYIRRGMKKGPARASSAAKLLPRAKALADRRKDIRQFQRDVVLLTEIVAASQSDQVSTAP